MKKKASPESLLNELISLTDEAILNAQKNNIAAAGSCIKNRRQILEGLDIINNSSVGREDMRDFLGGLLKRDEELKTIVRARLKKVQEDRHKYNAACALRQRFTSRRTLVPKFIDKKV